jgi:hypothetical protein
MPHYGFFLTPVLRVEVVDLTTPSVVTTYATLAEARAAYPKGVDFGGATWRPLPVAAHQPGGLNCAITPVAGQGRPTHYYAWKNNARRAALYRRACCIVKRSKKMNSLVVAYTGYPERDVTSGNAVRRLADKPL